MHYTAAVVVSMLCCALLWQDMMVHSLLLQGHYLAKRTTVILELLLHF